MVTSQLNASNGVAYWIQRHQYKLALAGIIAYNNWILAIFFNPHATLAGATISELSVRGQPWSQIFQWADVVAGILLALGMNQITRLANDKTQRRILRFAMLTIGLSPILDAFLPLDCSSAISRVCARQEALDLVSLPARLHIIESVLAYAIIILLPLVAITARQVKPRARGLVNASWLLLTSILIWGVESAWRFLQDADNYGYEQRAFIIIFTFWFIIALRHSRKISNSDTAVSLKL